MEVQDVLNDFREEFPKCAFRHKAYVPEKDNSSALYVYAKMERKPYVWMHYQTGMNGIKQDSILALTRIYASDIHAVPEALSDLELNVEKAVKRYTKAADPMIRKKNLELTNLDKALSQVAEWEKQERQNESDYEFE